MCLFIIFFFIVVIIVIVVFIVLMIVVIVAIVIERLYFRRINEIRYGLVVNVIRNGLICWCCLCDWGIVYGFEFIYSVFVIGRFCCEGEVCNRRR